MTRIPSEEFEDQILDTANRFIESEEEQIRENDMEPNRTSREEVIENFILGEQFEDDCFIPSPVLKGTSKRSFGPDLILALQKLGIKYNNLLKNHRANNSKSEIRQAKLEISLNKCLQECQLRYEAKHNECQHLISEIEMLRAKCETPRNKCLQECEPKYEALKRILAAEIAERKRFYNELIELRGNIRVFCRCRPLSAEEISNGYASVIKFDPSKDTELQITCADSSKKIFKFDHVFSPNDDQEAVFAETLPIVKSAMDGFNACIFAYGQTGTGKTFTMEGTPECRGVNYRALEELFRIMTERMSFMRYEISFSMLEVYNEKIRDLLADNSDLYDKNLDVKQSTEGIQEVPGLVEVQVCNIDEVWEMHKAGGRNRLVGSTNANKLSSRSHSLGRVTIKGENLVIRERTKSFLWLVDLAGSERATKIEAEGKRLIESRFINTSLLALGDVISALVSKSSHIPYRNSKLTRLLQNSLGGNCKTLMFAQISPNLADLGETLCTLNFANRVRGVEHGPSRKQSDGPSRKQSDLVDNFKLKQMVKKPRHEKKEVSRLNEKNVFRTVQEKVNLAFLKHKTQFAVANDRTRSFWPPFAPSKQRPPLANITNLRPYLAPPHKKAKTAVENMENACSAIKDVTKITPNHFGKARRISLIPVVSNILKNKRKASSSTELETLAQLSEKHNMNHTGVTTKLSQLRAPPLATLTPLQEIPNGKGKSVRSLKYPSTSQLPTLLKSRLPNIPSALQQTQILSGGAGNSAQHLKRLRRSFHKRVILGLPALGSQRKSRVNEPWKW